MNSHGARNNHNNEYREFEACVLWQDIPLLPSIRIPLIFTGFKVFKFSTSCLLLTARYYSLGSPWYNDMLILPCIPHDL